MSSVSIRGPVRFFVHRFGLPADVTGEIRDQPNRGWRDLGLNALRGDGRTV